MKQVCFEYLMNQFGDKEVVEEIYKEYVASIQEKLTELDAALAAEDWTALDHVAHAVKGNSLATGDNEMADTAIALRTAAKLSEKANALDLINKIKELAKGI